MKSVIMPVAFCLLASTFAAPSAMACIAPQFERYLLFKQMPETTENVTFKSRIRIENISLVRDESLAPAGEKTAPVYPPTLRAELYVLASETHPELVTQMVVMEYELTSCGPHLAEGLSGFLVGNLRQDQDLSAMPKIEPTTAIGSLKYYPVFQR